MDTLTDAIPQLSNDPRASAAIILGMFVVAAAFFDIVVRRILVRIAKKTRTTLDDEIISAFRRPVFYSFVLIGVVYSMKKLGVTAENAVLAKRVVTTVLTLVWAGALMKTAKLTLTASARLPGARKVVQNRTLPIFDILLKFLVIGGAIYSIFLTWHVDVTAWLASAGIVGIAVGFAAKDTLANFFSGIFILADAPYKIGDFIVLDSGERGQVTDIGIRSTRILTREDIQIIIPNAAIGAAKIVNETGGPHPKRRIAARVGVSYESDIDRVRDILMQVARDCELVADDPEPRVRFRAFGDSSLDFELLCWINEPVDKGRAQDLLNTSIFKQFKEKQITIPFPQRDIHMRAK